METADLLLQEQVGQVLFHDIPLGHERFPGKGQKNEHGHDPSPEGQADATAKAHLKIINRKQERLRKS